MLVIFFLKKGVVTKTFLVALSNFTLEFEMYITHMQFFHNWKHLIYQSYVAIAIYQNKAVYERKNYFFRKVFLLF